MSLEKMIKHIKEVTTIEEAPKTEGLKRYKVTMWNPMTTIVKAENETDAIDKAVENDNWEAPHYAGTEKIDVLEIGETGNPVHDPEA